MIQLSSSFGYDCGNALLVHPNGVAADFKTIFGNFNALQIILIRVGIASAEFERGAEQLVDVCRNAKIRCSENNGNIVHRYGNVDFRKLRTQRIKHCIACVFVIHSADGNTGNCDAGNNTVVLNILV